MDYIRKALVKGYLAHPGSACCTDDMFEIFVRFGRCVCAAYCLFCQQADTMSAYKFTPRAVASPDAPQKLLVHKRACSGGAEWVKVTRHPAKQAKKPRTIGSQQPACTHKEHQILTTAEAASFASQFWDRKVHPTKASLHEFPAMCIDVPIHKRVCPDGVPALVEGNNNADSLDSE